MPAVPIAAKPAATTTLTTWTPRRVALPCSRPSAPPAFTAVVAKTPVSTEPTIPPTPWQAKTSRVSSRRVRFRAAIAT
jgi:hypothetical protein